jgi:hypothetical protein
MIQLPCDITPVKLADCLELSSVIEKDGSSAFTELKSSLTPFSSNDQIDNILTEVTQEISLRVRRLGEAYPFEINKEIVKLKSNDKINWAYLFCLMLSYIGPENGNKLKIWNEQKICRKFEKICFLTALNYIKGQCGASEGFHFGTPRVEWGEHKRIDRALAQVKYNLNDGNVKYQVPSKKRIVADGGDGGLDLIVWRDFPDGRVGKLLLLGQCSASKEDYINKASSDELDKFNRDYFAIESQKIKAFFLPHLLSDIDEDKRNEWIKINRVAIVFDRSRIAIWAQDWSDAEFRILLNKKRVREIIFSANL